MKTKKKRQVVIGLLLLIISFILFWYITREKVYCGTVTNKINALEYNKNVSHPDPILIVKFDINHKKKEIHCSWITYTECDVNEQVCFSERIAEMEPMWIESGLILLISAVFLAFGVVIIMDGLGVFDPTDVPY